MYQERKYRREMGGELEHFVLVEDETDLWIGVPPESCSDVIKEELKEHIKSYRELLKKYICGDPEFQKTLKPYLPRENAPEFIREMAIAASKAEVGPMASVAGAFARIAGEFLQKKNIQKIIVENGGDIFISGFDDLSVGVFAGDSPFSDKIAMKLKLQKKDFGVCSSSGAFGHSFSFGKADVVTVICEDILLSDALATSVCNRIQSKEDIGDAIEFLKSISAVSGGLIIKDDRMAVFGNLEIVRL